MSRLPSASQAADAATIFCAMLYVITAVSAPATHLVGSILGSAVGASLTGAGWNLTDTMSGISNAPELFRKAENNVLNPKEKMVLAWINAVHFGAVLPAFSLWGLATIIQSIKAIGDKALIYKSGAAVGTSAALAGSAFAFAAGMFVNASISGYAWFRATQHDAPYALLEDNIDEFDALNKTIKSINEEITAIVNKKLYYADEQRKLQPLKDEIKVLESKQNNIKEKMKALYACALTREKANTIEIAPENKQKIKSRISRIVGKQSITDIENNDSYKKSISQKGEKIIRQQIETKKTDTIANIVGGVGAVLGGLAVLLPPAAIPLLAGCAVCFAFCAFLKGIQWYQKSRASSSAVPGSSVSGMPSMP